MDDPSRWTFSEIVDAAPLSSFFEYGNRAIALERYNAPSRNSAPRLLNHF